MTLEFVDAPPAPTTANFLLYGSPGSGKTVAAASLAKRGPLLWLNCEGRGALAYARKVAGNNNIFEVEINDQTQDVVGVFRDFVAHVLNYKDPQPGTVVIDTLGKLRDQLIRQLVNPGSKDSLKQYGEVSRILGTAVRKLRDHPVNVVLIAHERVEDAENDRIVRPLIGGNLTEIIPGEVDVMAYTSKWLDGDGKAHYSGLVVENKGRRAKDRSGALGDFRELNLDEWLGVYLAALAPDADMPWAEGEPEVEGEPTQEALA